MTEHTSVDELLIAHAAGKLPEPVGLAIATHLAMSPAARARYARYEALGGVLLDEQEPVAMALRIEPLPQPHHPTLADLDPQRLVIGLAETDAERERSGLGQHRLQHPVGHDHIAVEHQHSTGGAACRPTARLTKFSYSCDSGLCTERARPSS